MRGEPAPVGYSPTWRDDAETDASPKWDPLLGYFVPGEPVPRRAYVVVDWDPTGLGLTPVTELANVAPSDPELAAIGTGATDGDGYSLLFTVGVSGLWLVHANYDAGASEYGAIRAAESFTLGGDTYPNHVALTYAGGATFGLEAGYAGHTIGATDLGGPPPVGPVRVTAVLLHEDTIGHSVGS